MIMTIIKYGMCAIEYKVCERERSKQHKFFVEKNNYMNI